MVEQWTEDPCVASSSLALGMGTLLIKKAVSPSGKAVDCKSSIPSSNLGAAFNHFLTFRGRGGMVDTTDLNFEHLFVSSQIQKNSFLKMARTILSQLN